MTLGQAYESFHDFGPTTVERYPYPGQWGMSMWLDKDYWWDVWQYNYAFVGQPNQTLLSLFGMPEMVVEPAEIVYVTDHDSPPITFKLRVESSGSRDFGWTATLAPEARWLTADVLSGTRGQDLEIVVDPAGKKPGTYQIDVRIVANDPSLQKGDQTVSITLHITRELHNIYLPATFRSAP